MASIRVFFRNGDVMSIGCANNDVANRAYEALIADDVTFVDLSSLANAPRFGVRASDISTVICDPGDQQTMFLHSALIRDGGVLALAQRNTTQSAGNNPEKV